jgi:hypothetical protein
MTPKASSINGSYNGVLDRCSTRTYHYDIWIDCQATVSLTTGAEHAFVLVLPSKEGSSLAERTIVILSFRALYTVAAEFQRHRSIHIDAYLLT